MQLYTQYKMIWSKRTPKNSKILSQILSQSHFNDFFSQIFLLIFYIFFKDLVHLMISIIPKYLILVHFRQENHLTDGIVLSNSSCVFFEGRKECNAFVNTKITCNNPSAQSSHTFFTFNMNEIVCLANLKEDFKSVLY